MAKVRIQWPCGDGEMASRIRDLDWTLTPLGAIARWSERLKLMVELLLASPFVSSLVCGPERILIYNDAASKLYGDLHPAALGRPLPKIFPEGWATVAPFYGRAFAGETVQVTGQPLDTRGEGLSADVFDALLTPVRETDGQITYVLMAGSEVGDRLRTEAALRASDARNRLLIESVAQAVWETDGSGVVIADSPSWRAYTGQTLEEWLGYGWLEAIHPDDRAYAEQQWGEAIGARRLFNAEYRLRSPSGGWRWTNVRATPVPDAGGVIERWVGMNIDIDARRRAEAALRESEERYQSLFVNMGQGYTNLELVRNSEGRAIDQLYLELNPAMKRIFGLDAVGMKGRKASEFFGDAIRSWAESFDTIVKSGIPTRIEDKFGDRWFGVLAYPQEGDRLAVFYEDITETRLEEAARRENEERQAFLLMLSDALRPLAIAEEIRASACRLLGQHLGADRTYYVEYLPREGLGVVADDYLVAGLPSLAGHYPFEAFRATYERIGNGDTWVVLDVGADVELPAHEREFYAAQKVYAWVNVPLAKAGILEAALCVVQTVPRPWTTAEISIVKDTAERLWSAIQRGRAEAELRESEERFRQFAHASAAGLWIQDAATLAMEFVSPSVATIYGVEPTALLGDVARWAARIVPEDRTVALHHLEAARGGETVAHEFRIQRPSDLAFRWIRNINFPLYDNGEVRRIGGITEDVTEAKLATEHSAVLLAELQHRVRNIMAMIRSITARTGERAESVPDYAALMAGRLMTLARVQTLLTRSANVGVGIIGIVQDELGAQAQHEGQYTVEGPDLVLAPKAAEVLTLAVHELTTNALKYGALSLPEGHVTVRWATFEKSGSPWLGFDWTETGAFERATLDPATPRRRGFGSELIEGRVPYELRGRGRIDIEPTGARCHLEFPLRDGDSILETDAPQRATVFGGSIDMTGEADLSGHRVLVIEDDYYLATDTARALQGAGADVMGPCPDEAAARDELADERPDAAVVDINLGVGPSFKLAETLKDLGIPFIFTTGYDPEAIPAEFDGIQRLQKPLQLRQIVAAVSKLLPHAP